ncbi:hypothetical protein BH10PSE17_BH10PSE17_33450 [soil metagenome]
MNDDQKKPAVPDEDASRTLTQWVPNDPQLERHSGTEPIEQSEVEPSPDETGSDDLGSQIGSRNQSPDMNRRV